MARIEIVCHRGANAYAPENTYASTQRCIDWGVDYVEIDVNRSQDGVFYLFHGPDVARTTNGQGRFPALTSTVIDQLDAGSWFAPQFAGERVPRLEPFLRWVGERVKLFLDIKAGAPDEIIALIRRFGLAERAFVWCGDDDWALHFRTLAPDLQLKINANDVATVIRAHDRFDANIVEIDLANMSEPLLAANRERGIKTMIYARGQDETAYRQVLAWGVDMVNLDHADLFLKCVRNTQSTNWSTS